MSISHTAAALARQAGQRVRSLRQLWREFTGEAAYDKYVERHRREHPDHEPMSAREFWRARDAFAEDNVQTGCC